MNRPLADSSVPKKICKKTRELKSLDISASWLSRGDPVGFPPHPRGWFSFVLYQMHSYRIRARKPLGINVRLRRRYLWVVMQHLLLLFDISVSRMVRTGRDLNPWFFTASPALIQVLVGM
jgi:hypothetical protein